MKLIISGRSGGKEEYVLARWQVLPKACTVEETLCTPFIASFQDTLRQVMASNIQLETYLEELFTKNPQAVILCDEVGMGIVPIEKQERVWRELVGRACCLIAHRADEVVRLVCGIPQTIKKTEQ